MFFEGIVAVEEMAEIAMHCEMEFGVVVVDGCMEAVDYDFGIQFFFDFTHEGFFPAFSLLDFTAWEFPPAAPLTIAALGGKDLVVVENDCGNHFYNG